VFIGWGAEMGRISMATRDELVGALAGRYAASNRKERDRILDEVAAVSGLHRKHAIRLLRAWQPGRRPDPRRARHCERPGDPAVGDDQLLPGTWRDVSA
jgi:hypothetical protein